jgi:outer membrane receptor protein involved in Fe transport
MAYLQDQRFDGFSDITGGSDNQNNQLVQKFIANSPEPNENFFEVYNVTGKYELGKFNAVSSSSYNGRRQRLDEEGISAVQLLAGTSAAFPTGPDTQTATYNFSQEVRLATSESVAGFDSVVGAFYSVIHTPTWYHWSSTEYNSLVAGNDPTNPLYWPGGNIYQNYGATNERQMAEFFELTYHLIKPLSITTGLRHYHVANSQYLFQYGWFVGGNIPGVNVVTGNDSRANGFVYKGNISYKITEDQMLYAQYSEGFRPGFGNNPIPPGAGCDFGSISSQVEPDSIKNYEFGGKTQWLDHRLTINVSGYRTNWKNIQQGVLIPSCGYPTAANFGSAVIKGFEFESYTQLTRDVSLGLSGTYMHTTLQEGAPLLGANPGDPIEAVPKWQYALWAQTKFPVLEAQDGFARVDYQYTGSSFTDYARLADDSLDPAHEVQVVRFLNSRIGVGYRTWEFALSGTNLLNNTARQSLDPWAGATLPIPGRPRYVVTRPRTFSISASYQF